ncbi:MAG: type II toxin-antitoxin system HicA family toxin [Candidatus Binataceae bacterium]
MKLPILKAREVIRALERLGFQLHHSTGSHRTYKHPITKRRAVVPYHANRDLTGCGKMIAFRSAPR